MALRATPLISHVRPRYSRIQMPALVESTSLNRSTEKKALPAFARAARPASLAASARSEHFLALAGSPLVRAARPLASGARPVALVGGSGCKATSSFEVGIQPQGRAALRGSLIPVCKEERVGGFGLFAGCATQRTMHAGCVLLGVRPNPSVERTCPGKPGQASHLKR